MNLYWIYDIPTVAAVGVFAALFVGICWTGTILFRPIVRAIVHHQPDLNETVGDFLQYFGVIYGLLLGLLAVATYQNLSDVEKAVGSEASSLAALYRDVGAYPEPARSELQGLLRDYTRYVIDEAWPLQQKGIVPVGAVKKVAAFSDRLASFEPETKAQEALHDTALRQFNMFFEHRRTRLYSVTAGIPAVLWYTVAVGALLEHVAHLAVRSSPRPPFAARRHPVLLPRHHDLADRADGSSLPGEVSISPHAFELVYDQLMKE